MSDNLALLVLKNAKTLTDALRILRGWGIKGKVNLLVRMRKRNLIRFDYMKDMFEIV